MSNIRLPDDITKNSDLGVKKAYGQMHRLVTPSFGQTVSKPGVGKNFVKILIFISLRDLGHFWMSLLEYFMHNGYKLFRLVTFPLQTIWSGKSSTVNYLVW